MATGAELSGRGDQPGEQPAIIDFITLAQGERITLERVDIRTAGNEEFSREVLADKFSPSGKLTGSMRITKESAEETRLWLLSRDKNSLGDEFEKLAAVNLQFLRIFNKLNPQRLFWAQD